MAETSTAPALESGTYEVIRRRLSEQAQELRSRLEKLNARRTEVFGGGGTAMLSTQRVRTEHNCVPRDLVRISGEKILLGYHVHLGLKSTTEVGDVFAKIVDAYVDAGLPNSYILQMLTTKAARLLGVEKQRGAIRPGLAADLIAMPENPLEKIQAIKSVAFVMKDGSVCKGRK